MPKSNALTTLSEHENELLSELSSMRALLQDHACDYADHETILGVLRLCPGLSLERWPALSEEYGLRDWLALPMEGGDYPVLEQIQETLRELAHQTQHDPLTGLANRRAFEHALEQESERAKRTQDSLSLAMFDLDDFKSINDTHGHPMGDEVLARFASTLLAEIRRYDMAARLGGEEFAVLLPGAGLIKAKVMVERMLESVRALEFPLPNGGGVLRVTCSAGLACYKGYAEGPAPDMVAMADKALYEAKAEGKDRLVAAPLADTRKPSRASLVESNEKKFLFTGN